MLSYLTLSNLWALLRSLLDILCLWAIVYYCLRIVKNNSRTIQIFKGILLIIIIKGIASVSGLHTMESIMASVMSWGVIAIIVIFQPEIRSMLEKIGKTNVFSHINTLTINEKEHLVEELVKACSEMSKTKTGALISIEQGHSLSDFIKTGTAMNSVVSSELLCSIFQYGTPLHDGAVIIQGVKIACAAAYFPPTTRELPTSYGARHRAAVGISEITDSITIVVSEETGNISIAEGGKLTVISETGLKEFLMEVICSSSKSKDESEKGNEQTENISKHNGVFAHYFKGKNKKAKIEKENRYTKKKKDQLPDEVESETITLDTGKEMEIANLVEEEQAPLDHLFENIVETEKKEEKKEKKASKRKSRKKEEKKEKIEVSNDITNMANDLFNDVVEPEKIVLHYEKDDEEDSFTNKNEERSDM